MVANFLYFFFFNYKKNKNKMLHKLVWKKKFPVKGNLILCVYLFVCLSVCQCHCKTPTSRGQKKFWSKFLAPVLASDETILEIFHFNDISSFKFLYVGAPVRTSPASIRIG